MGCYDKPLFGLYRWPGLIVHGLLLGCSECKGSLSKPFSLVLREEEKEVCFSFHNELRKQHSSDTWNLQNKQNILFAGQKFSKLA